jgi:hypothetical protein
LSWQLRGKGQGARGKGWSLASFRDIYEWGAVEREYGASRSQDHTWDNFDRIVNVEDRLASNPAAEGVPAYVEYRMTRLAAASAGSISVPMVSRPSLGKAACVSYPLEAKKSQTFAIFLLGNPMPPSRWSGAISGRR